MDGVSGLVMTTMMTVLAAVAATAAASGIAKQIVADLEFDGSLLTPRVEMTPREHHHH